MRSLRAVEESWPLHEVLAISRGSRSSAEVVVVEIQDGNHAGRGECLPYPRYGETPASVLGQIDALAASIRDGLDRERLQHRLPPGAARNALDCALWDLEAKRSGERVWRRAGLASPTPLVTAYTISLGSADEMAAAAARNRHRPLLKLKLGAEDPVARVAAVRQAAPRCRVIVDANEAWRLEQLARWLPALADLGVELVEQPLPAGSDAGLAGLEHPVPIAADESCHHRGDLASLRGCYDVINIKLDKSGGLSEALLLKERVLALDLDVMVGCMVGTSLAMAPAHLLAQGARFADLDGPLLLARDRPHGLALEAGALLPPAPELWG